MLFCKVVNDRKQGLEAIRSEDFDLALLDLAMPEFTSNAISIQIQKMIYQVSSSLVRLHRQYFG
jgi:CheY-like chemotaxis protein